MTFDELVQAYLDLQAACERQGVEITDDEFETHAAPPRVVTPVQLTLF